MENEVMVVPETTLQALGAVQPMLIVDQVRLIQGVMGSVMKVDEHYGKIPGTAKNVLFKSGAEKLCFTFQLTPEFEVREKELPGAHREVVVTCHLINASGRRVATGVGSCSTMESKYRYRGNELIATGETVPSRYWDVRKADPKKAQEMIGGAGRTTKKDDDNVWRIYEKGEKGENPDIADVYNTVLKMAKKRAHVDATITATACSDIFTQDVEDLPGSMDYAPQPPAAAESPKAQSPAKPAVTTSKAAAATGKTGGVPGGPQEEIVPPSAAAPANVVEAEYTAAAPEPAAQPVASTLPEGIPATAPTTFKELVALSKVLKNHMTAEEHEALRADLNACPNDGARVKVMQKAIDSLKGGF